MAEKFGCGQCKNRTAECGWGDQVERIRLLRSCGWLRERCLSDSVNSETAIAENDNGTSRTRNVSGLGGGLAVTVDQAGTKTWQL